MAGTTEGNVTGLLTKMFATEVFATEQMKMSTEMLEAGTTEIFSSTEKISTNLMMMTTITEVMSTTTTTLLANLTTGISSTTTQSPMTPSTPGINSEQEIKDTLDTFFVLINSHIVFFLQAGFAFLEAGTVRSKNTTNILIKNILDCLLGALAFWFCGYMIASSPGNSFMGLDSRYLCLVDVDSATPHYTYWFFGFVFCATASTIVSGAVAERCELAAYFAYSTVISAIVYPVVVHWAWTEEGWLSVNGYVDFAGSGVVHHLGGVCGFVGALFLGPRLGRFNADGTSREIPGHSVSLAALGAFILMFGFFSFNGATNTKISSYEDRDVVQRSIINTMIGGTSSGLVTLLSFRFSARKKWSLLSTINGILCGMIATCAFCNKAAPWATFFVGIFAAFVYVIVHYSMIWFRIDDPLDAVAVHSGGGVVGVLATPFVIGTGGIFDADSSNTAMHQIWSQLVGLLVITAWSGGISALMFYILKLNNKLRLPEEIEISGVDMIKHGEHAYPAEAWQEQQYGGGDHGNGMYLPPVMRSNTASRKTSLASTVPDKDPEKQTGLKINSKIELRDFTNLGFEHSEDYGRNLEEGLEVDQAQDQQTSKMKNSVLVQRVMERDRTLEFNDSKESTMI